MSQSLLPNLRPFRILPDYERQVPAAVLLAAERQPTAGGGDVLAVLFLPFDPGPHGANRQRSKHWGQRTSQDDDPARLAALAGYRGADDPQLAEPAVVDVLVCRSRQMDDDNILAALKPARDQLCRKDAGGRFRLLPDDSPKWWVYGGVWQLSDPKLFAKGWTVLIVRKRGTR
jgi:hypothetical protein